MIRRFYAYLARQSWLRKLILSTPVVRDIAWRYVAGEDLDAGLAVVRDLNAKGIAGTLNYVGTHIRREEDAADQFAAYLLLQFAKSDARRLIAGVAYAYRLDASKPTTKKNPFADEHGLPAQRFYNVLCIAYGADSKLFADLVEKEYLPKERAEGCESEYEQVTRAMTKLIRPFIDQTRAKRVRAKQWLKFEVP